METHWHESMKEITETLAKKRWPLKVAVKMFKMYFLTAAMQECKGNLSKCSEVYGLHRNSFQRNVNEFQLQLKLEEFRKPCQSISQISTARKVGAKSVP